MNWLQWVQVVEIPILIAIGGWIVKVRSEVSARIDEVGRDLVGHKLDVARNYATNSFLKDVDDRLSGKLEALGEKMDRVLERLPRKSA